MVAPARLRVRVHGTPGITPFLSNGLRARHRLESALQACGLSLAGFERVLDFGCGCGRVLRCLESYRDTCRLYGSDIDREAIAWCAANIPFARFYVNEPLPPLVFDTDTFDLIYAISVLTHLDEPQQFRWLEELRRVARPGGTLVVSVQGEGAWHVLSEDDRAALRDLGFVLVRTDRWKGMFPDWYQWAYHTPDYVRQHFGRYFDVLRYIPRGLTPQQDLVVLRKPWERVRVMPGTLLDSF
jgi:SAM-dependent methyltransferase